MPAKVANDHSVLVGIGVMMMMMMAMVTTKIMDDSDDDDDDNDEDNDDEAGDDDVYDEPATCPQRAPCSAFIHPALHAYCTTRRRRRLRHCCNYCLSPRRGR